VSSQSIAQRRQATRRDDVELLLVVTARQIYSLFSVVATHAVYAARCYASAAYAVMRCLSVCLSRSCILSKRIDIIIFIFSPSGSHTILVFLHQTSWQYSDENSPNEASNAGGVAGNRHSEPISGSIACCQRCDRHRCYQHGAAGPWQVVTLIAGSATEFVDGGNDNEIFMTRSLNFSPKTTEQHLIACSDKSVAYVTNYFTTFLFSLGTPLGQWR